MCIHMLVCGCVGVCFSNRSHLGHPWEIIYDATHTDSKVGSPENNLVTLGQDRGSRALLPRNCVSRIRRERLLSPGVSPQGGEGGAVPSAQGQQPEKGRLYFPLPEWVS